MTLRIVSRLGHIICFSLCFNISVWPANGYSPSATQDAPTDEVKVLFTGRFLGYMRIPNFQTTDGRPCDGQNTDASTAARDFDKALKDVKLRSSKTLDGALLLGAGDNFSPEIEAREFLLAPTNQVGVAKGHQRIGKEFFLWNYETNKWITDEDFTNQSDTFKNDVRNGEGRIPQDNVACFFTTKGYAAIVPGRHDFYF